jgi:hypothetical protein
VFETQSTAGFSRRPENERNLRDEELHRTH